MTVALRLWRRGPLTDAAVVALAGAAWTGALLARPVPVVAGVAAVALAVSTRRAVLVVIALGLLTTGLAHQAWAGLAPLPAGPFTGTVTLVSDPEPSFGGWRADVRTPQGRMELDAHGGAGGRLRTRAAGERVEVTGRVERLSDPAWSAPRHVRARLVAERLAPRDRGTPWARGVNGLRSLVVGGARSLPEDQRALFSGFVLGDDRGGSVVVADDFDAAGLSHLLVVSGQNVAFVLAVAAPALSRLPRRGSFAATLALLGVFAAVTRFEPSVLRATAMAAIAASSVLLGRPVAGVRVLALAVSALVVVDPLLVHSLGFRLSAAAAGGLVLLARPLASALPGPRWLATAAAVTASAQVAVAPLLIPTFGPMPLAAIPANLLAEPVAGLVMMWGCTAGVAAGLLPPPIATLVHLPTRVGLWWVAGVARTAAGAGLGRVGLVAVGVAAATTALAVAVRRRHPGVAVLGALVAVAVLVGPVVAGRDGPTAGPRAVGGAELWVGAGPDPARVLLVPGTARADGVLAGLRDAGVGSLDLVVLRSAGPTAAGVLHTVEQRIPVAVTWAPSGSPAPATSPPPPGPVRAGGLEVVVRSAGERLDVELSLTR